MNARLVAISSAISVGLIALALALDGSGQVGWEGAARWTARHSFLWFLAAFAAPGVRYRRGLGLSFAAAHFIHFSAVLQALAHGAQRPVPVFVLGGAGYVLLAAMALTSNDVSQRVLGAWWKRLHRVGIWTLWALFLVNYAGRVARPESRLIGLWGIAMLFGVTLYKYGPRWRWTVSRVLSRHTLRCSGEDHSSRPVVAGGLEHSDPNTPDPRVSARI